MYDFLNLDSFEFEQLCSEVLSIYLKQDFRIFCVGKDEGIDIRLSSGGTDIIGQAKRHKSVNGLYEDEIPKLQKLSCKKYYLFIACGITPQKRTNLFNTFKNYMDDEDNIFDAVSLNSLLEKSEYKHLVEKHFRLWATSLDVINLLVTNKVNIDASTLVSRIEDHKQYYVETFDYINAVKKLKENRLILIKGEPGVGKTTISEMLVLRMMKDYPNIRLIYTSSSNSEIIKDSMSNNPEDMEIIYIDDFLGDIYLNLTKEGVNGICSLISYIKSQENKFLILNTRVVILNTAIDSFIEFQKSMDRLGITEISINHLTKHDKAKILYNHIYFSELSEDIKKEFIDKKQYFDIINHTNYSPRLIECMTNTKNFELSGCKDYLSYCKSVLENQEKTWDDCYQNNLTEPDRILLLVLYSLISKTYSVYESYLRTAYNNEISSGYSFDTSIDNFKKSLARLTETFISVSINNGSRFISFLNPSVKECIKSHEFFNKNKPTYFEQIIFKDQSFLESSEFFEKIKSNKISDFQFSYFDESFIEAVFFYKNSTKIFTKEFHPAFLDALTCDLNSKRLNEFNVRDCDIFKTLIEMPIFKSIDLNELDEKTTKTFVLTCLEFLPIEECKTIFDRFDHDDFSYILDDDFIKEYFLEPEFDNLDIQSLLINNTFTYSDYEEDFDEEMAIEDAINSIEDTISDDDKYNLLSKNYDFTISRLDISEYLDDNDLGGRFDSYLKDSHYDYSSHEIYGGDDSVDIDLLFSSLLK